MPGIVEAHKGFIRHQELMEELNADVHKAYELLEENKESQYLRRCVVRALFSYIEAYIECIKIELRSVVRVGNLLDSLSDVEKEVLGSLVVISRTEQDKFFSLAVNVKKTFKLAIKLWKIENFQIDTGGLDFQDFLKAINARNKLTHPKNFYDIEVTDYDMHCHTVAGLWIKKEIERLIKAHLDVLLIGFSDEERERFFERHKEG